MAADEIGVHVMWRARRRRTGEDLRAQLAGRRQLELPAEPVDTVPRGHRSFPDIASADRRLAVVFQDPRADPSYPSLSLLPRGNTATGQNSGAVVRTFVASSANGGRSWSELQVSTAGSNPNWRVGHRHRP